MVSSYLVVLAFKPHAAMLLYRHMLTVFLFLALYGVILSTIYKTLLFRRKGLTLKVNN